MMKTIRKGFTILEVVVSLVLLSIGFQAFIALVYWGKFHFKQTDTYSKVMSVGLLKMDETLSRSYADLTTNSTGIYNGIYWNVNITTNRENSLIPYKLIEVKTSDSPNSNPKRIEGRLQNVVPYPYIHSFSKTISDDGLTFVPEVLPPPPDPTSFLPIGGQTLSLSISCEVPKNLMILYNISVEQEDITGILPTDTIYTGCFIDGIPRPVLTRTPIFTQPLISNVIGIDSLPPGPHRIEVRWCKDTNGGRLRLRDANLIVLAFENVNS